MTSIAKPPTGALIVLALAGFWWLTQRGARASTSPVTRGAPASQSPTAQTYRIGPSMTVPAVSPITQAMGLVQALGSLFGGARSAVSASGLPANSNTANQYGFDAVQGTTAENLAVAYSFGGPSMGVYGASTGPAPGAPWGTGSTGVALGPNAAYYGVIRDPATFTGDPYNDGGGGYDSVIINPAPGVDWVQPWTGPK